MLYISEWVTFSTSSICVLILLNPFLVISISETRLLTSSATPVKLSLILSDSCIIPWEEEIIPFLPSLRIKTFPSRELKSTFVPSTFSAMNFIAAPASSAIFSTLSKVPIIFCKLFSMLPEFVFVPSESFLISPATTAKPAPAFPAWAATIAAFIANKLVLSLISSMADIMSLIEAIFVLRTLITDNTSFTFVYPLFVASSNS